MNTRTFALIFGIVFLAVGVLGFVPSVVQNSMGDGLHQHGMLLGLFMISPLHNAVHLIFGLWGLAASRSTGGAVAYFKAVAVVYALLTVLGLIASTADLFGMVPLMGNNVYLHAALAIIAAFFGFVNRSRTA
jgi:hypothetical protein